MKGGKSPKRKGTTGEREFCMITGATRIPLSGAAGRTNPDFAGDVIWPGVGKGEIKRRKAGFKQIYSWLEGNDFLAIRADRREWLVVFPLGKFLEITGEWGKIHGGGNGGSKR